MNRSTLAAWRRAAAATLLCAGAAFAATDGDVHAPLALEAGTWDAEVTFYEAGQPSGSAKGVQVNTLLANGHWITNDFRIPATGTFPPYQGHGVWGWDPVAKTYVNTWVDTNDRSVRTDYGYWHAKERTMVWSAKQSDGEGHFIDYRFTEAFRGDTRVFTAYQLGIVVPNPHRLVKIVFTRRPAGALAEHDRAQMLAALQASADGWNRGDLKGHLAIYDATVNAMTRNGPRPGVAAMEASFREAYFSGGQPKQALRMERAELRALSADSALMTGRFVLAGGGLAEQSGWFTLVWVRTAEGWKVVHDHSS